MNMSPKQLQRARRHARIHARRRARERLGIKLSEPLKASMVAAMQNGGAKFLRCGKIPTRTRWALKICGQRVVAIYDEKIEEIVSIWSDE